MDYDFNLKDEYKADPLLAQNNYTGNVIGVALDAKAHCIAWKIALDGNGGVMSDGETPVDGAHVYYRNWLPLAGDENEMSSNGRSTKRQTKINMLNNFAEGMGLDMNTPKKIVKAIEEQDWIGIPVVVKISVSEYQGNTRNQVDQMSRAVD